MKIEHLKLGPLQTNCYILSINNDCIIVDPADEIEKIEKTIDRKKLLAVLITHNHFDHVGSLEEIISKYNPVICNYDTIKKENIKMKDFMFDIILTGGHTNDSVSFYFEKEKAMFTGDFLFKESIGRTDLGGNDLNMAHSLNILKDFPDNIKIYPGHGATTELGYEKKNNHYLNDSCLNSIL